MRSTKRIDIAPGTRFAQWTVLERAPNSPRGQCMYVCRCDCGKVKPVNSASLRRGNTTRCPSCARKAADFTAIIKHGVSNSRTWRSWDSMRARCKRATHPFWHRYGGRGITVCERWQTFENFLADMGVRPEGLELDRIDTNGNYEPGNCRWVTHSDNLRNRAPYKRRSRDEVAASRRKTA